MDVASNGDPRRSRAPHRPMLRKSAGAKAAGPCAACGAPPSSSRRATPSRTARWPGELGARGRRSVLPCAIGRESRARAHRRIGQCCGMLTGVSHDRSSPLSWPRRRCCLSPPFGLARAHQRKAHSIRYTSEVGMALSIMLPYQSPKLGVVMIQPTSEHDRLAQMTDEELIAAATARPMHWASRSSSSPKAGGN